MGTHTKYLCLFAGLLLGQAVTAEQWFTVARPGERAGVLVEVDLDSVGHRSVGGEAVIRASYDRPQPHAIGFGYRSFVGTAQFDCERRSISLASAAYFALPAAQGVRLGADSSGREAGMPPGLLESLPAAARQALLRATCATARGKN